MHASLPPEHRDNVRRISQFFGQKLVEGSGAFLEAVKSADQNEAIYDRYFAESIARCLLAAPTGVTQAIEVPQLVLQALLSRGARGASAAITALAIGCIAKRGAQLNFDRNDEVAELIQSARREVSLREAEQLAGIPHVAIPSGDIKNAILDTCVRTHCDRERAGIGDSIRNAMTQGAYMEIFYGKGQFDFTGLLDEAIHVAQNLAHHKTYNNLCWSVHLEQEAVATVAAFLKLLNDTVDVSTDAGRRISALYKDWASGMFQDDALSCYKARLATQRRLAAEPHDLLDRLRAVVGLNIDYIEHGNIGGAVGERGMMIGDAEQLVVKAIGRPYSLRQLERLIAQETNSDKKMILGQLRDKILVLDGQKTPYSGV
jgi:hypothetical protein